MIESWDTFELWGGYFLWNVINVRNHLKITSLGTPSTFIVSKRCCIWWPCRAAAQLCFSLAILYHVTSTVSSDTWLLLSRDRSPKCERNSLAVWKSWQGGGGAHSFSRSMAWGGEPSPLSPTTCRSSSWDNSLSSPLGSSRNMASNSGMDLSLQSTSTTLNNKYWQHRFSLRFVRKYFDFPFIDFMQHNAGSKVKRGTTV